MCALFEWLARIDGIWAQRAQRKALSIANYLICSTYQFGQNKPFSIAIRLEEVSVYKLVQAVGLLVGGSSETTRQFEMIANF